ncbi:unnamed protein product [Calicophoron daubneyi]|uniref:Uncharacterized protein n=1 Tax=Calicophoron daubneyi TaxID=300641 RepID=A0AAV2T9Y0_CALDB
MSVEQCIRISLRGGVINEMRYPPNETWCAWMKDHGGHSRSSLIVEPSIETPPSAPPTAPDKNNEFHRQLSVVKSQYFRSAISGQYTADVESTGSSTGSSYRGFDYVDHIRLRRISLERITTASDRKTDPPWANFSRYYFAEISDFDVDYPVSRIYLEWCEQLFLSNQNAQMSLQQSSVDFWWPSAGHMFSTYETSSEMWESTPEEEYASIRHDESGSTSDVPSDPLLTEEDLSEVSDVHSSCGSAMNSTPRNELQRSVDSDDNDEDRETEGSASFAGSETPGTGVGFNDVRDALHALRPVVETNVENKRDISHNTFPLNSQYFSVTSPKSDPNLLSDTNVGDVPRQPKKECITFVIGRSHSCTEINLHFHAIQDDLSPRNFNGDGTSVDAFTLKSSSPINCVCTHETFSARHSPPPADRCTFTCDQDDPVNHKELLSSPSELNATEIVEEAPKAIDTDSREPSCTAESSSVSIEQTITEGMGSYNYFDATFYRISDQDVDDSRELLNKLQPFWWPLYQTRWPPFMAPGKVFPLAPDSLELLEGAINRGSSIQLRLDLYNYSRRARNFETLILVDTLALSPFSPIISRLSLLNRVSQTDREERVIGKCIEWLSPSEVVSDLCSKFEPASFALVFMSFVSNWLGYLSRLEVYSHPLGYSRRVSVIVIDSLGVSCLTPACLGCGQSPVLDGWPLWLAFRTSRLLCSVLTSFCSSWSSCRGVFTRPHVLYAHSDVDEI